MAIIVNKSTFLLTKKVYKKTLSPCEFFIRLSNKMFCFQEENKGNKANEIGLDNVGGVFVVLLAGMGVACTIAVIEFLWKYRKAGIPGQLASPSYTTHQLAQIQSFNWYKLKGGSIEK